MIDKCPDRSPLIVAKTISNIIKDKIVCDVGCRNGDMMEEFLKYGAKSVVGVDCNIDRIKICQTRGLNVIHKKIDHNLPQLDLPKADIYYIWVDIKENEKIAKKIKNAIVIIAGDPSVGETYNIPEGGKITIPYNEGDGVRQKGIFNLIIIDKRDK